MTETSPLYEVIKPTPAVSSAALLIDATQDIGDAIEDMLEAAGLLDTGHRPLDDKILRCAHAAARLRTRLRELARGL